MPGNLQDMRVGESSVQPVMLNAEHPSMDTETTVAAELQVAVGCETRTEVKEHVICLFSDPLSSFTEFTLSYKITLNLFHHLIF